MRNKAWTAVSVLSAAAVATALLWGAGAAVRTAAGHCQVPCGIYDDPARIGRMREDARTIEKAIRQLGELAGKTDPTSLNQAVRWVTTKESHASHIITVVSEYFLTQKVKPVAPHAEGYAAYLKTLADHHAVLVAAMKTKQVPTPETVEALNRAIDALAVHYASPANPAPAAKSHGQEHGHGGDSGHQH